MGLTDRVFGAKRELPSSRSSESRSDARIVDRYQRMLRTADTRAIGRVHVEAFERLTPEQLRVLFERFIHGATDDEEKPADPRAATPLAHSAAHSERRRPGAIARTLGPRATGIPVGIWATSSIRETVAAYALASALWGAVDFNGGASAAGEGANARSVCPSNALPEVPHAR
jgi:hypothetical protein